MSINWIDNSKILSDFDINVYRKQQRSLTTVAIDLIPYSQAEAEAEQAERKLYPAMSQEEIEDWMEHIPVFAVTDSNGAGVILKPDDDTSVFYFFFNPLAANATLTQLKKSNEGMDLKVSAFSLGKIWFKLLNADPNQEVMVGSSDIVSTRNQGKWYNANNFFQ